MRKLYSRSCSMVVESLEQRSMLAATPFLPGKLNQSINFTQYPAPVLDMGDPVDNHLDLGANFTIENWVKFDALPDAGTGYSFVSKDQGRAVPGQGAPNKWIFGYGNFTYATNKTFFHITNSNGGGVWIASNAWTPQLDTWYHVAVVKSTNPTTLAQTYRFYLNGVQNSATQTVSYTVPDVEAPLQVGRAEYNPGHPAAPAIPGDPNADPPIPAQDAVDEEPPSGFWMIGSIDDVRIWNTARTLSQVSSNYSKELVGNETGLVGYWKLNELTGATADDATSFDTTGTYLDPSGLEVPVLHSKPGAKAIVYLDFNGDFVKTSFTGEHPKIIDPYDTDDDLTTFSPDELTDINDIWSIVSEVYAPFDIDVTTADPNSYHAASAVRIEVGDVNSWNANGPYGYLGFEDGFTSADYVDHIAFAWNRQYVLDENNAKIKDPITGEFITVPFPAKDVAYFAAGAVGFTLGLKTQSTYDPAGKLVDSFNPGTFEKAPIMGDPRFSDRWLWWNGTTTSAFTYQNDIAVLIKTVNGFGYRADEFGNTIAAATAVTLTPDPDTSIPTFLGEGVITTLNDVDVLKFQAGAGNASIIMYPANLGGQSINMLDSDIELRDAAGNLLKAASDGTAPSLDYNFTVGGTYFLFIKSHGSYGDIGKYNVKITTALPPTGSITGTVFGDTNNDGTKQAGESGLASQTVYLDLNSDGSLTSGEPSTLTAADGTYSFSGLLNDTFKVRVVIPSGYALTTALANPTVVGGGAVSGILIGLRLLPNGKISGTVFTDTNNDGAKAAGEAGFASQTVFLDTNNDGALSGGETSATTAADGSYSFSNLAAGTYKVRVVIPSGYSQSTAISSVTLSTSQQVAGILIGLYKPAGGGGGSTGSLSGVVFGDTNVNGIFDAGDSVGASRTVFLDLDGDNAIDAGEKTAVTDANGKYTFTGLTAGTYHVRRVYPAGYVLSGNPVDVTLAAGQALTGLNIGSKAGTSTGGGGGGGGGTNVKGSIGGLLFFDTNKNAKFDSGDVIQGGKTVFIDANGNGTLDTGEIKTTTDSVGKFNFTGLSAGTYKIRRVLPAGYKVTTPAANITITAGQIITNVSIGTTYA